jgi:hypothetical protein
MPLKNIITGQSNTLCRSMRITRNPLARNPSDPNSQSDPGQQRATLQGPGKPGGDPGRLVKLGILSDLQLRLRRQKACLCQDIFHVTCEDIES